jgi:hypothetical protein
VQGGCAGVGAVVRGLVIVATLLAACGQVGQGGGSPRAAASAAPTPSAAEMLARPARSTMRDMHFDAVVHATGGGQTVDYTGQGDMVVRPYGAFRFVVQGVIGGRTVSEEIITRNGTDYVRQDSQKFKASPSTQASDVNTWRDATGAALLGEEALPTGTAWHVRATSKGGNTFEAWIRESDGYLLRYVGTSTTGNTTFTYTMTTFNTGVTIDAPQPGDVT